MYCILIFSLFALWNLWTDRAKISIVNLELWIVGEVTLLFFIVAQRSNCTYHVSSGTDVNEDFGNFENGKICGMKWYDYDGVDLNTINGIMDAGEVPIEGFKIELWKDGSLEDMTYTDSDGRYCFEDLGIGDYTIKEVPPSNLWMATTPMTIQVSITTSGQTSEDNDFGNICLGPGGGHTPGFWSNKNGRATLMDGGTLGPEFEMLSALNLVNRDGTAFDLENYAEFRSWLLRCNAADNMAYKLSVSLACMALNVEAGFVDPNALVYAPGIIGGTDFITIQQLMDAANTALGEDSLTPPQDPNRDWQELLYEALDDANNNKNFLCSGPCPIAYSYATTATTKKKKK